MKNTLALVLFLTSLAFFTSVIFVGETSAGITATCFCKISKDPLWGVVTATGVVKDLTGDVNKTFWGQGSGQQDTCEQLCRTQAQAYIKNPSIATAACAANAPNGTSIDAYSAVGTSAYRLCQNIGTLANVPQITQTTCTCPPSWYSNTTNVLGGVTTDGKCKKMACGSLSINPAPANGTQVGSWGFTWGNSIWAYSSNANGGAPSCITTVVHSGSCGWY